MAKDEKRSNFYVANDWRKVAKSLINKGDLERAFRFESTSAHQRRIIRTTFLLRVSGSDLSFIFRNERC